MGGDIAALSIVTLSPSTEWLCLGLGPMAPGLS